MTTIIDSVLFDSRFFAPASVTNKDSSTYVNLSASHEVDREGGDGVQIEPVERFFHCAKQTWDNPSAEYAQGQEYCPMCAEYPFKPPVKVARSSNPCCCYLLLL